MQHEDKPVLLAVIDGRRREGRFRTSGTERTERRDTRALLEDAVSNFLSYGHKGISPSCSSLSRISSSSATRILVELEKSDLSTWQRSSLCVPSAASAMALHLIDRCDMSRKSSLKDGTISSWKCEPIGVVRAPKILIARSRLWRTS